MTEYGEQNRTYSEFLRPPIDAIDRVILRLITRLHENWEVSCTERRQTLANCDDDAMLERNGTKVIKKMKGDQRKSDVEGLKLP